MTVSHKGWLIEPHDNGRFYVVNPQGTPMAADFLSVEDAKFYISAMKSALFATTGFSVYVNGEPGTSGIPDIEQARFWLQFHLEQTAAGARPVGWGPLDPNHYPLMNASVAARHSHIMFLGVDHVIA